MTFQTKHRLIDAEQFFLNQPLPFNTKGPYVQFGCGCDAHAACSLCGRFYVTTAHGNNVALSDGDWVVLEPSGPHVSSYAAYPVKPDIFAMSYEQPASADAADPTAASNGTASNEVVRAMSGTIFAVWDKHRACWAGDEGRQNERSLEDYALDEFKADQLVYCDMEGWAIENDGSLLLVDECGNFAYADAERYEVRWAPEYLAARDLQSAARWRARALAAEADPHQIRNRAQELARAVLDSKQNIGHEIRDLAKSIMHWLEEPPSSAAVDPVVTNQHEPTPRV